MSLTIKNENREDKRSTPENIKDTIKDILYHLTISSKIEYIREIIETIRKESIEEIHSAKKFDYEFDKDGKSTIKAIDTMKHISDALSILYRIN